MCCMMERNSEEAQVISKQCNKTDELIQPADFIKVCNTLNT